MNPPLNFNASRRLTTSRLALLAVIAQSASFTPAAFAQTPAGYPARPVKFISTFPPGGPSDILSSAGSGSPGHLAAQVFAETASVKVNHIGYKGNTPAVLPGEVDGGVLATPGMLPHGKAGKITALAVTSRQRSKLASDTPSVAEAGLKTLEQEVLYIAMLPAATPEPLVEALQRAFADALTRPKLQPRLLSLDLHHEGLTGAAADKRFADLHERYGRVIKATGMKVE